MTTTVRVTTALLGVAALAGVADVPRARAEGEKRVERRIERGILGQNAHLGVSLGDVGADDLGRLKLGEARGALVRSVESGSPAEKAGLKADDVIVGYDGERVRSAAHLARLVRETPPGRQVTIEVSRGGAVQKLTTTLDESTGRRLLGDFDIEIPELAIPPIPPMHELLEGDHARAFRHGLFAPGRRKLGIEYLEIEGQLARYFKLEAERGVLVSRVDEEGPAGKAGLAAGDVILEVEGRSVRDGDDLRAAIERATPGKEITLKVQREGRPREVKVKLPGEASVAKSRGPTI